MKEQGKSPPDETNEEEIGILAKKEFRVMIVKMIQNIGNIMQKIKETLNKDLKRERKKERKKERGQFMIYFHSQKAVGKESSKLPGGKREKQDERKKK